MIKKTITYKDYNDVERTEDFYFNFTEVELMEMEHSMSGGLSTMIRSIVDSKDDVQIMNVFKDLVLKAYGEKSDDGKRFVKSDEISANFSQTPAYPKLFMELAADANAATAFINGIIPQSVAQKAKINSLTAPMQQ